MRSWDTGPRETRPQRAVPEVLLPREPAAGEPAAYAGEPGTSGRPGRAKPGKGSADGKANAKGKANADGKAKAGAKPKPDGKPGRSGRRTGRRRISVVPVVAVTSAVVVLAAAGTTAYYKIGPGEHVGSGSTAAFNALQHSQALNGLAAERQQILAMNAAVHVVSRTTKPMTVNPASVLAAMNSNNSTTQSTATVATGELSPLAAQQVAQQLMPTYGFSVSGQWSCLYDVWMRESGWQWDAENTASGAYGIPQSLPASKMAMFGSDYLTDATTQIKWGLWYIQNRYGTPCGAWDFELNNGFY